MIKTLIISHIDMDGSGVVIMYKKIRPLADVIHVNYGWESDPENIKKLDQYDELLIGDISFSPEFATILHKSRKKIILCDHHISAINKFTEAGTLYDWMFLDETRCGTLIVYDLVKSGYPNFDKDEKYKKLAILIDDYDRWVHNDPKSISLQFLWHGLGQDKFEDRFINNPSLEISQKELEIIEPCEDDLTASLATAIESMNKTNYIDNNGYTFNYCSNVPHFVSLVAMMIQKRHPELDYLLLNGGYGSVSIRSTSVAINNIAEALGGGGHPQASGFAITPTTDVVKSVINRKLTNYDFYNKFNKEVT